MSFQVLLVTSSPGFGESIQRFLGGMGVDSSILVGSVEEAVELSRQSQIDLAILDFNLGEYPLRKTAQTMREVLPNIRLLITSSQDKSDPPIMSELTAVGVFSEPFYLVDLEKRVPEITEHKGIADRREPPKASAEHNNGLPWLQDITRAAQHLASLSLSTAAKAALIVRGDELWAYAGQLSQSAAQELTEWVVNYWSPQTSSDLVRFVDLAVDGGEYMLYATCLSNSMVLALAFDAKMPFSRIRSQANYLASALASPPGTDDREPYLSQTKEQFLKAVNGEVTEGQVTTKPLFSSADVPPPTPGTSSKSQLDLVDEVNLEEKHVNPGAEDVQQETSEEADTFVDSLQNHNDLSKDLYETPFPRGLTENSIEEIQGGAQFVNPIGIFVDGQESMSDSDAMSVSPSMYSLDYTCLLVPRLPRHTITGELSDQVDDYTKNIFLAFGWRLESLEIHPEYFQWSAHMPPNVSPGYMMHVMREHLSRFIFAEFPRLARENPSGDFWAPGYLLVSGQKTFPGQMIDGFIKRTRRNQDFQHE
jgi:DNA-binding response OmpR family regulator/REP element-mobilizing transposase RayT